MAVATPLRIKWALWAYRDEQGKGVLLPVLREDEEGPPDEAEVSTDGQWATLHDETGPVKTWVRISAL